MKKVCILLAFFTVFLFLFSNSVTYAESNGAKESEIIIEKNTKRILFEKDARQKMFMASTTKIMTAITVIESSDLNQVVKIKPQYVGIEGSSIYLKSGEELTVKELLYGLMLSSGNDCAVTLAYNTSGSIEAFATLMNKKAIQYGANNSHFVNPHGLHDDNHYTTAYDLAIITAHAMQNEIFRDIVSTKRKEINDSISGNKRILVNKNKLLVSFEGANGVKTGFTKKAGRCLVSSAVKNGIELICVVLNCSPMFETSKALLEQYSQKYKNVNIYSSGEIIDFIKINNRKTVIGEIKKCGVYIKDEINLPLKENELNELKITYDFDKTIQAPIACDQIIGNINFYIQNNLIFSQKVYTINAVE